MVPVSVVYFMPTVPGTRVCVSCVYLVVSRCFKDILEAEEERVETGLAIEDMEATGWYCSVPWTWRCTTPFFGNRIRLTHGTYVLRGSVMKP